ncbi:MAG: CoA pyrophosphatase [Dehalococcoidia bacterium]|nr:CoA pyrophosphatase [Dehalococcoidia bacterium]
MKKKEPEIVEQIRKALKYRKKVKLVEPGRVPAAVLIPLLIKKGIPHIIFTRRTDKVEYHKGQISFPGGAAEDGETVIETALRESEEEIGLNPADVEVLGELDDMLTLTSNFVVSPVVASVSYPYSFTPNPMETEEIIELPLEAIRDEKNWRVEENIMENVVHPEVHFLEYNGVVIWGATAKILKQLVDILEGKY